MEDNEMPSPSPPIGYSTAAMASCMSALHHANPLSLKPLKYSQTASASNPRKSMHKQGLSPVNLKPLSASSLRNSTPSTIILAKPLNQKRYTVICCCSPCNSTLKEQQREKKLLLEFLEAASEDALLAAANLRVRTFYEFKQSFGVEEHRRYRSQLEFQALKDRIAGKLLGFQRVTCVIATIPISTSLSLTDDLCSLCKAIINGEERIVVGTLDLNQSNQLPDEIPGTRPKGIDAQFTRAYLTNVCVAQELQRKGIGGALIIQAVKIAQQWGMTDLYVHVAVDNDAARCLYEKSGFIYESDEPAWRARFLGRPRRFLLWANMNKFLSHQ